MSRLSGDVRTAIIPSIIAACASCGSPANDVSDGIQPFSPSPCYRHVDESALQLGLSISPDRNFPSSACAHGQQKLLRLQRLRFPVLSLNPR